MTPLTPEQAEVVQKLTISYHAFQDAVRAIGRDGGDTWDNYCALMIWGDMLSTSQKLTGIVMVHQVTIDGLIKAFNNIKRPEVTPAEEAVA